MRTKNGRPLTDADLERLAAEAEAGYDLSTWVRRRGRPPLDAASPSRKVETRLPAGLRNDLKQCAASEGKTVSQVLRDLVEVYVSHAKGQAQRQSPRQHD